MKNITITVAIAAAVALSACGKKEEAVSFNTLEEAKAAARDNALFNAQRFRQENPAVQDWSVVSNGDSSQMPDCPQGDGWATLTLYAPKAAASRRLKCSTVSGATGCLFDEEFKTKPYAAHDGHCQPVSVVPFPLPKIAK